MMNPYRIGLGPGHKRLPQMSHGKAPVVTMILGLGKTRGEKADQGE